MRHHALGLAPGTVVAQRAEKDDSGDDDATGTELTISFSPVPQGWHYNVTAHTACLPAG